MMFLGRNFGFLWLVLVSAGCAKSTNLPSSGTSKRPVSSDVKIGSDTNGGSKESSALPSTADDWTVEDLPLADVCKAPAGLGFRLEDGLSANNRYMLARFAKLGGSAMKFDQTFLSGLLAKAGFSKVKSFENKKKGVQGFSAHSDKMNLVVFRGTHSSGGVLTDLNFFISGSSLGGVSGGVHGGFKDAYDSVKGGLQAELNQESAKGLPTFFVGHSLGGALSMLAAADALSQGVKVAGLLTLGQPRTGNAHFAANFSSALREKYFRYVHANDPVPHLPPAPGAAFEAGEAVTENDVLKVGIQASAVLRFGHVGVPQHLGQASFSEASFYSDDKWDKAFWASNKNLGKALSGSSGSGGATATASGSSAQYNIVSDHEVEKYLCELVKQVK